MEDALKPVPPRPGHGQYQYQAHPPPPYYEGHFYNGYPNQANGYTNQANFYAPGGNNNPESTYTQFANLCSKDISSTIAGIVNTAKGVSEFLDCTHLAMISSYKSVLSMSNQAGQAKSTFGQIWHAINMFKLFQWLHSKLKKLLGWPGFDEKEADIAWNKAVAAITPNEVKTDQFPWLIVVIIGIAVTLPYLTNKFISSKFKDTVDPKRWESPGYVAQVVQKFDASAPNEMSIKIDDEVIVAPHYIQLKMNMLNSDWCFAVCNDKYGIIPLNHIAFRRKESKDLAKKTENNNKENLSDIGEDKTKTKIMKYAQKRKK